MGKNMKNLKKIKIFFFFTQKRVKSIRNYVRNPKKLVLMLYDYYFLRKLDFFIKTVEKKFVKIGRMKKKSVAFILAERIQ